MFYFGGHQTTVAQVVSTFSKSQSIQFHSVGGLVAVTWSQIVENRSQSRDRHLLSLRDTFKQQITLFPPKSTGRKFFVVGLTTVFCWICWPGGGCSILIFGGFNNVDETKEPRMEALALRCERQPTPTPVPDMASSLSVTQERSYAGIFIDATVKSHLAMIVICSVGNNRLPACPR